MSCHKVLHLTHTDIRFDSRIIKEIVALRDAGLRVDGIGIDFYEGIAAEDRGIDDVLVLKIYSNHLRRYRFVPKLLAHVFLVLELTIKMLFYSLRFRPTIVHCHDTLVLPLGVLLKAVTGAKLIYDAHELESNKNGLSALLGKMTFFAEKVMWGRIDGFITVSESILGWYKERFNFEFTKTEVVLNSPLICRERNSDSSRLRTKYQVPEGVPLFIYVGLFGSGRFIEELLEIFSRPDIDSHIVFLGYGLLQEKIEQKQRESAKIHIHKPVRHDEVVAVTSGADVGLCLIPNVSLSDHFSLPNKVFEYIFSGIPIFASDMPEIKNLVEKHKFGVCCSLDFETVLENIKNIEAKGLEWPMPRPDEIEYLGWQNQVVKLERFYNSLVNE